MKVKEKSEKVCLRLNIQKTKIMASGSTTSWQIDGETVETVTDFLLGVSKITADSNCSHEIKRCLLPEKKVDAIQPSHPLFPLLFLPSIFPSIRVFSSESALHISWPKYWSFSFSISPSSEHSGLMSFRMDWLDLLAVQGTLKSLLQHHSSKASILWCSAFFTVQLVRPYTTTGKTIALIRRTVIGIVMCQV